jgi:hypothetical protein
MPRGWPKGKLRGPKGPKPLTARQVESEPAKLMRAWRLARGFTQRQAGLTLGCSDAYIAQVERGATGLSNKYREKMGLDPVPTRAYLPARWWNRRLDWRKGS